MNKIIWKDRKRIIGIPLTFTKYKIENNKLFISKGFFNTVEDETLLYRILDIKLKRTLADKIFGVGTLILYVADESDEFLKIEKIRYPKKTRNLVSGLAEKERRKNNIIGKEFYLSKDRENSELEIINFNDEF